MDWSLVKDSRNKGMLVNWLSLALKCLKYLEGQVWRFEIWLSLILKYSSAFKVCKNAVDWSWFSLRSNWRRLWQDLKASGWIWLISFFASLILSSLWSPQKASSSILVILFAERLIVSRLIKRVIALGIAVKFWFIKEWH